MAAILLLVYSMHLSTFRVTISGANMSVSPLFSYPSIKYVAKSNMKWCQRTLDAKVMSAHWSSPYIPVPYNSLRM